jgi:hypothetical protein
MRRIGSLRRSVWLAVAVLVGGAAVAGIAFAAIPDSQGVVHGCYSANGAKGTGGTELRIVDSANASCSRGQTSVSLNGVPPEAFVPVGQFCSGGLYVAGIRFDGSLACQPLPLPKAYGATIDTSGIKDVDAYVVNVGSLSLPEETKTYFVTAHVGVLNVFHDSRWKCELREGSAGGFIFDEAQATTDTDSFAADLSLQSRIRVTNASVWVTCSNSSNENNQITHARIDAVEVAAGSAN